MFSKLSLEPNTIGGTNLAIEWEQGLLLSSKSAHAGLGRPGRGQDAWTLMMPHQMMRHREELADPETARLWAEGVKEHLHPLINPFIKESLLPDFQGLCPWHCAISPPPPRLPSWGSQQHLTPNMGSLTLHSAHLGLGLFFSSSSSFEGLLLPALLLTTLVSISWTLSPHL